MFREKNLIQAVWTNSTAGFADRLTDSGVQNEPDVNDKNFVFVQGYNVNPNQARGWSSEMFKRLYWSGSRAKFYGVTWLGYDTQRLLTSKWYGTPNFHTNVFHAFQTAPKLKEFVQTLTNGTVSAAFSLGNLAVLSAISDWGAHPAKHFMIDAAVPVEAIDGSSSINTNMIHPEWYLYTNRLYANEWFQLFPANDARSTLSWSNRVANLPLTNIYNFYSSGEEVLRTHVGSPPSIPGFVIGELLGAFDDVPMGTYTWAFQEKMKGRTQGNAVLGSNHGGWGFSTNPAYYTNFLYQDGWVTNRLGPAEVANVPAEQLRTNAFFQMTSSSFAADAALYGPSASAYAQANRERILSDAIPALTLPVGANAVPTLSLEQLGVERNFLMPDLFKNGWPSERPASGTEAGKWYHSDVREVAYTYIYKLFDEIVNDGNLE
jgi:hypothetical protein